MSQPFNRRACPTVPGKVDEKLGEFWSDSPWELPFKHNLSMYERNRMYLNVRGKNFLDVSYLSNTDSDGDGRSAVALDFNHDGRQDLMVRQVSGGPLLLFENRFPGRHYLMVSLRGAKSNRLGIGARLTARIGGRQIVRELFPVSGLSSQEPSLVHFGLEDDRKIDDLTILWPSGLIQHFANVAADRHVLLEEGSDRIEVVTPGMPTRP